MPILTGTGPVLGQPADVVDDVNDGETRAVDKQTAPPDDKNKKSESPALHLVPACYSLPVTCSGLMNEIIYHRHPGLEEPVGRGRTLSIGLGEAFRWGVTIT